MDIAAIQSALRDQKLDGWLFYDHHYRDPLAYRILGLGRGACSSRGAGFIFIPAEGEPKKLVHRIEAGRLDALPGSKAVYSSWQELEAQVEAMLAGRPGLPCSTRRETPSCISRWSMPGQSSCCGEWARRLSAQPISSASLRRCSPSEQMATHFAAQQKIDDILDAGWKEMGSRVRAGGTDEFAMVEYFCEAMRREGLLWDHGPNVSVGSELRRFAL